MKIFFCLGVTKSRTLSNPQMSSFIKLLKQIDEVRETKMKNDEKIRQSLYELFDAIFDLIYKNEKVSNLQMILNTNNETDGSKYGINANIGKIAVCASDLIDAGALHRFLRYIIDDSSIEEMLQSIPVLNNMKDDDIFDERAVLTHLSMYEYVDLKSFNVDDEISLTTTRAVVSNYTDFHNLKNGPDVFETIGHVTQDGKFAMLETKVVLDRKKIIVWDRASIRAALLSKLL